MQARNQQVTTIIVGANTWIVVGKNNKPAQGALADLKVGETVSVAGTSSGTNQIDARVVRPGAAGIFAGNAGKAGKAGKPGKAAVRGGLGLEATVQSISNGALTLTAGKNNATRTVNTDAGTIVIKNGLASVTDLKAGDKVQILPRRAARQPGTTTPAPGAARPAPTAELIYVPSTDHVLSQAQVKSVSGNTLTLGAFNGGRTVNVDANTVYKTVTAGQAPATAALSDVKAGARIVVYAAKPAQGQTATRESGADPAAGK